MFNRAMVVAIITSLLIGIIIGYGGASMTVGESFFARGVIEGGKSIANRINQRFVERGLSSSLEAPVKDVYGFVRSVSYDGFVLEYDTAQFSVAEWGVQKKRVHVSADTKIERVIQKLGEPVTLKELIALGKPGGGSTVVVYDAGKVTTTTSGRPNEVPYKTALSEPTPTTISLADIKIGEYVHVSTTNDVRTSAALESTGISVFDLSSLPEGVPADPSKLPFSRSVQFPN